jgi:paraquat-inducible protein A
LSLVTCALFVIGVLAPCMTTTTEPTGFLASIFMSSGSDTCSVLSGIWRLWTGGDYLLASLLFIFSVAFPATKLAVTMVACVARMLQLGNPPPRRLFRILTALGKWSMLDVFVLALLVVLTKGFPREDVAVDLHLRWGAYLFVASILGGMLLTSRMRRLLVEDFRRPSRDATGA